ncbi:MAG: hypothetical protein AAF494_14450 [Pseudomonadota bacterium]
MTTTKLKYASVLTMAALACACSSTTISSGRSSGGGIGSGLTPASRLVTLEADGSIPDQNFASSGTRGEVSDIRNNSGAVSGFAYQYGRVQGSNQYLGVAGIVPTTDPGGAPTDATATYRGDYAFSYIDRGRAQDRTGKISLDADFTAGTLEGQADGLEIDGTINGQTVGGTASFRDVDADMRGVIGSERAVAAFAGNNNGAVLVGGVNADIQPEN